MSKTTRNKVKSLQKLEKTIDIPLSHWYNGIITNWYYQKGDIYEITRH